MTNEYGERLDQNGYAPSIVWDGECYICGAATVARHEVYGGSRRSMSKKYGLWTTLCPVCHEMIHHEASVSMGLKRDVQRIAQEYYGWSAEEFRQRVGKNYDAE